LAAELRTARLQSGLSLRALASASGLSSAQVSRIERGLVRGVSLRSLTVLFTVLGMRLSARPDPLGSPIRDAAHARLLDRLRWNLGDGLRMRLEVPVGLAGDLRAWDAQLHDGEATTKVEAETVLYDVQAMERRIAVKMADDQVERVLLVVARTRRNRQVIAEFRKLLAHRYDLSARATLITLRAGRLPPRSSLLLL
jgi:transcriptional regulator with XRE-family HTH domain